MRKILIIISLLLFPLAVSARECSYNELENYRNQLNNVSFDIEYVPKGTEYKIQDETIVVEDDNLFKIKALNLPNNYQIKFYENENLKKYLVSTKYISYIPGGVYNVSMYNEYCDNSIKEFQFLIPFYSPNDKNVWFDGTYENNTKRENNVARIIEKRLIIVLAVLVIGIIAFFTITKLKKEKKL